MKEFDVKQRVGISAIVMAAAGVAACAMSVGMAGCEKKVEQVSRERPAVEVKVSAVERMRVERTVNLTGTLYGREEATLAAKVGGRVTAVTLDVGDSGAGGSVVIQIDPVEYELAVAERKAALSAALAKVGLGEMPAAGFDASTVPTVARARAEAENAKSKLDRARPLIEAEPPEISAQEFNDLKTEAEVALRDAEVALLNANASLADARTQAAMLATASQRLDETAVKMPVAADGGEIRYSVAARLVSVGEIVSAGQAVARVVAADVVKFKGEAPEQFAGRIAGEQRAVITLDSEEGAFEGKVSRVAPRIDARSRAFEVEIVVGNERGKLKPGAFARAGVVVKEDEGVAMVPEAAVVSFAGVTRVFGVKDGKAVEYRVETGVRREGKVEIVGGLAATEVVTQGAAGLVGGQAVKVGS